jgi:hypothetical protein
MTTVLTLEAIEVHAEGEPGRVITSAAELVRGSTMAQRFDYCRAELEPARQFDLARASRISRAVRRFHPAANQPWLGLWHDRARTGRIHSDVGQ